MINFLSALEVSMINSSLSLTAAKQELIGQLPLLWCQLNVHTHSCTCLLASVSFNFQFTPPYCPTMVTYVYLDIYMPMNISAPTTISFQHMAGLLRVTSQSIQTPTLSTKTYGHSFTHFLPATAPILSQINTVMAHNHIGDTWTVSTPSSVCNVY